MGVAIAPGISPSDQSTGESHQSDGDCIKPARAPAIPNHPNRTSSSTLHQGPRGSQFGPSISKPALPLGRPPSHGRAIGPHGGTPTACSARRHSARRGRQSTGESIRAPAEAARGPAKGPCSPQHRRPSSHPRRISSSTCHQLPCGPLSGWANGGPNLGGGAGERTHSCLVTLVAKSGHPRRGS